MVECGGNCNEDPYCAALTELHEVRCCSEQSLGDGWELQDGCTVWGESEVDSGSCPDPVSYEEAVAMCAANGARLCTQEEMTGGCTASTGCSHDYELVWTSTTG